MSLEDLPDLIVTLVAERCIPAWLVSGVPPRSISVSYCVDYAHRGWPLRDVVRFGATCRRIHSIVGASDTRLFRPLAVGLFNLDASLKPKGLTWLQVCKHCILREISGVYRMWTIVKQINWDITYGWLLNLQTPEIVNCTEETPLIGSGKFHNQKLMSRDFDAVFSGTRLHEPDSPLHSLHLNFGTTACKWVPSDSTSFIDESTFTPYFCPRPNEEAELTWRFHGVFTNDYHARDGIVHGVKLLDDTVSECCERVQIKAAYECEFQPTVSFLVGNAYFQVHNWCLVYNPDDRLARWVPHTNVCFQTNQEHP
ncbi:hypothetical protein Pelo_11307 [Pelomyxa schiedti]|nr:hypothetical protein Pelo_11307 [Pelomyxa schiedti]